MPALFDPSFDTHDFSAYRREESTVIATSLAIVVVLVVLGFVFWPLIGPPSVVVMGLLGLRAAILAGEFAWLREGAPPFGVRAIRIHAVASVVLHLTFAALASLLSERDHSHYAVLFALPVVSAAFRLSGAALTVVTIMAIGISYGEVYLESQRGHTEPPLEYFENTMVCLAYIVIAVTVRRLARGLRERELRLAESLAQLEATKDRLAREEGLAAVGRLAAALAHEIRNPIALISSAHGMAKHTGADTAEFRRLSDMTAAEIARLERLTADFLAYARGRPPERQRANLAAVAGAVAGLAGPGFAGRGIVVQVEPTASNQTDDPTTAEFDPWQIQQALLNLVLNACQASPDGGLVTISCAVTPRDRKSIITVSNAGPAIPPTAEHRLFEPFFTTRREGTGLGLAISRSIARAHGGDVELTTNRDGCVEFSLWFPASGALNGSVPTTVGTKEPTPTTRPH